ncbi:MAG: hypothetical protein ABFC31_07180 [Clostridiaceae bacterium]
MQIIGVKFNETSIVYSYYCTIEDVKIGDTLLTPEDKAVTVVALDVDPATIGKNIMSRLKTITKRGELVLIYDTPDSIKEAYVEKKPTEPAVEQTDLITIQQLPVISSRVVCRIEIG